MTKNKVTLLALLAGSLLLSACQGGGVLTSSWPGILVDGESVYVAFGQHVYSLQTANGQLRWQYPQEPDNGSTFFAPPALTEDGQLIVAGYNGVVHSLDAATGGENWRFAQARNRFISGPLAAASGLFVANADRFLYALDNAGNLGWSYQTEEPIWAAPVTDGSSLYVASMDHSLYALDPQAGTLLWSVDLGTSLPNPPAFDADGRLYLGTFNGEVLALDSANGGVLWRASTQDWVWASPTVAEGVVYAGDISGNLYAIDAATGEVLWRASAEGAVTGAPLLVGETVYFVAETDGLIAIHAPDGVVSWREHPQFGRSFGPPVLAGDLVLIGVIDASAFLIAYDTNGVLVWEFSPAE